MFSNLSYQVRLDLVFVKEWSEVYLESITFGSEFVALRVATELIDAYATSPECLVCAY